MQNKHFTYIKTISMYLGVYVGGGGGGGGGSAQLNLRKMAGDG